MTFFLPTKFLRHQSDVAAFSLVEVVIAIGVMSFSGLAIIGVMSMGFTGNHDALERASGTRTLGIVANCLRSAAATVAGNTITYNAALPFNVNWTQPVTTFSHSQYFLTEYDSIVLPTKKSTAHQVIDVAIIPPVTANATPSALIVVAWPAATAQIIWSGTTPPVPTVTKAQGYELLYVYLNVD